MKLFNPGNSAIVTFLGWWKRDPFKRCWWPPTRGYKGHGLNHLDENHVLHCILLVLLPIQMCKIGGAKGPRMMYFPTKWGAKEPQNPQNQSVGMVKKTAAAVQDLGISWHRAGVRFFFPNFLSHSLHQFSSYQSPGYSLYLGDCTSQL